MLTRQSIPAANQVLDRGFARFLLDALDQHGLLLRELLAHRALIIVRGPTQHKVHLALHMLIVHRGHLVVLLMIDGDGLT